jgi:hypothetical protein
MRIVFYRMHTNGRVDMKKIYSLLFTALLLTACSDDDSPTGSGEKSGTINSPPQELTGTVSLESIRALPEGTEMFLRTSFAGGALEDLQVKLVTVVDDMSPPLPMIMLEASDPKLVALGGVASGMSGSPVILEGKIVGALALSFDNQGKPPYYFFATPIEEMIRSLNGQAMPMAKPLIYDGRQVVPIAAARVGSGLATRHAERRSFSSAASGSDISYEIVPGSPIGVAMVMGDEVNFGDLGTVTYVDGDRVYAFGHSLYGWGRVGLPIVGARIVAEMSDSFSPWRYFTLGKSVMGSIDLDRMAGTGGTLNAMPHLIDLVLEAELPGQENLSMLHQMPLEGVAIGDQAYNSSAALFSPIQNRMDFAPGYSVRTRARIAFEETGRVVEQRRIFSRKGAAAQEVLWDASSGYESLFFDLFNHEYLELTPRRVELHAEVVDSLLIGRIRDVEVSPLLEAGAGFEVRVHLDIGDGREEVIEMNLVMPEDFVAGSYQLEVGSGWDLMEYEDDDGGDETIEELLDRLEAVEPSNMLKVRLWLMEQIIEDEDFENEDFEYVWDLEENWGRDVGRVLSGLRWLEVTIPRE